MRFSVWPSLANSWDEVLELSRHAEATGWDGIWCADHFMSNDEKQSGHLESFAVLSAIAAEVPRVQIGTLVAGNTYRHPAVLANVAGTIDRISDGRFVLGVGAGWQTNEHEAYGIELAPPRQRLDRFEEACAVLRSLFANDRTTFAGTYYQLNNAPLEPRPIHHPLPLLVGGGGEKRTMRIAARYADRWNYWGTPTIMRRKLEVLDAHCAEIGRDPKEITRSTQALLYMSDNRAWLDEQRKILERTIMGANRTGIDSALIGTPGEVCDLVAQYGEYGIEEIIIPDTNLGDLDDRKRTYDLFRTKVIDALV